MKVSELSRRTGVSIHRLRRYEALGLIQAERTAAGYRQFGEGALREVVFVSLGRELGFSLEALAQALPRFRAGTLTLEEVIEDMRHRVTEVDALIAEQCALRAKLVQQIQRLEQRRERAGSSPS